MKVRRDKAFAHIDAQYFKNPEEFFARYPVSERELAQVIRATSRILRRQHMLLFDSDLMMEVKTAHGLDTVLNHVRARYGLPHASFVTLTVYNTLGQQVAQLVNEQQQAGYHDAVFRGDGLASGVYFYRIEAGGYTNVRKLLLLK